MQNKEDPRVAQIMAATKSYPNFPKEGINFIDVFPIVANPHTCNLVTELFAQELQKTNRGFIFAVPLTLKTGKPCYPIRKKGKLPGQCIGQSYGKQYGKDQIEVQKHCIQEGDDVVIVDDLFATGGTVKCAVDLLKSQGANIAKILIIVQLQGLNGRKQLGEQADKLYSLRKISETA